MSDDAMRADDEVLDIDAAELGMLLRPVAAPPGDPARARLLARAGADRAAAADRRGVAAAPTSTSVPLGGARAAVAGASGGMPRWAMGLAMVVPAAAILMMMQTRDELATTRSIFASADRDRTRVIDSLTRLVADREANLAALTGAQVSVVNMADARSQKPMGRVFWDQATDKWTFVAHHLPMPPRGRTYQLWLVVAGQKINCGTFLPGANGSAEVRETFAVKPGMLQAVAVTEEPMGGMPQPTGPMIVVGKAVQ